MLSRGASRGVGGCGTGSSSTACVATATEQAQYQRRQQHSMCGTCCIWRGMDVVDVDNTAGVALEVLRELLRSCGRPRVSWGCSWALGSSSLHARMDESACLCVCVMRVVCSSVLCVLCNACVCVRVCVRAHARKWQPCVFASAR